MRQGAGIRISSHGGLFYSETALRNAAPGNRKITGIIEGASSLRNKKNVSSTGNRLGAAAVTVADR